MKVVGSGILLCSSLVKSKSAFSYPITLKTRGKLISRRSVTRMKHSDDGDNWIPLDPESIVSAPCLIEQTLCQPTDDSPQLAKDVNYASAILDAWKQEEVDSGKVWRTEVRQIRYKDKAGVPLYGHLVRRPPAGDDDKETGTVPGILLFHTGAGPHDLFLLWKAAALVNAETSMPQGCVVLLADTLSDDTGWAWSSDRTKYEKAQKQVFKVENQSTSRPVLQQRILAAIDALTSVEQVDANRLAALGWCLGGHPILELCRMKVNGIKGMATFHGVFDGLPPPPPPPPATADAAAWDERSEILICHGTDDPFVTDKALELALETIQNCRHTVSLLQLRGAKHGFSNPAQDFNENPAFGFDPEAADKAWRQTLALLKRTVSNGN